MYSALNSGLWLAAQFLEAGILVALFARGWHQQYPRFTAYIILQLVGDVFLTFAQGRFPYAYYFGYWASTAVTIVLTFAIFYEVARQASPRVDALRKLGWTIAWMIVVLIFVQELIVLWGPASYQVHVDSITSFILYVDGDLRVAGCGTGLLILVFLKYLGTSRREFAVGIVAGFVFFSAIHMLVTRAMMGPTVLHRSTLSAMNSGTYLLATFVWLGYAILSPKSVPGGAAGSMPPRPSWPGADELANNS